MDDYKWIKNNAEDMKNVPPFHSLNVNYKRKNFPIKKFVL